MNPAPNEDLPHIDGYEISRRLGRGGMADVYLAMQSSLARPVAIKVLSAERTDGEDTVTRFEQEARTIARLDHPNIVSIFDVGRTADGRLYYVMPYLPNGDLSTRDLREDEAAVIEILRALIRALGFAHKHGIIHRDVKPENVLFDKLDRPLLADFGIALAMRDFMRVTREGSTIGSSGYMSPEQSRGLAIDGRSDLYSLGVVAYEMLSGELPYKGPDTLAVALAHVEQPIPRLPPRRRRWQPFIDKAMAKSPDERFQSAEQMEAALDQLDAQPGARAAAYATKPLPAAVIAPSAHRSRVPATVLAAVLLTLAGAAMIVYAIRHLRQEPPGFDRAPAAGTAPAPAPSASVTAVTDSTLPNAAAAPAASASPAKPAADGAAVAETAAAPPVEATKPPTAAEPPKPTIERLAAGSALRDRGGPLLSFVPEAVATGARGVDATHGFALARYEITRREYAAFVLATGREAARCREPHSPLSAFRKLSWREPGFEQTDTHPVVCVSWADANAYAQWLGKRLHAHYRLPTHAEWVLAARAQAATSNACARGNLADDKRGALRSAEHGCSDGFEHTGPVGSFKPNRLGIHDLVGNVSEWTLDCKGGGARADDGAACQDRMFSGSSWRDDAQPIDFQDDADAQTGYTTIGFRLLRELDDGDMPAVVK